ncbi:MAG: DUF4377 domain-containing protein [Deltaproteobacteria bacterium]|nr:DUF4377 domain-containing protein [Deltaproteobacteria bacterium]
MVCQAVGPSLCFEATDLDTGDDTLLYESIEGFDPGWCNVYEMKVRYEQVLMPPADGSSRIVHLVELTSTEPTEAGQEFSLTVPTYFLGDEGGSPVLFGGFPLVCEEGVDCADLFTIAAAEENDDEVTLDLVYPGDGPAPLIAGYE